MKGIGKIFKEWDEIKARYEVEFKKIREENKLVIKMPRTKEQQTNNREG